MTTAQEQKPKSDIEKFTQALLAAKRKRFAYVAGKPTPQTRFTRALCTAMRRERSVKSETTLLAERHRAALRGCS
jgi:hypothetical protein